MSDHKKKLPGKHYSLISAQIRLNQYAEEDEIKNELFDRRLKGFHLFCVIMFGTFLLDGFLPYNALKTKVLGTKVLANEKTEVRDTVMGKITTKSIITPVRIDIITKDGGFITTDISGYSLSGTQIEILRTPLFKVPTEIYSKQFDYRGSRWINFSGNFMAWPILAFLISLSCLVIKRFYGSPTLAVIAILNIVPFFTVVYKT
ncbi:MAG TPA: hypothetical protein VK177_02830 [Flavobacteriales bacterium]|nr:hypothetical protein [Flavobacteriales bacterium]